MALCFLLLEAGFVTGSAGFQGTAVSRAVKDRDGAFPGEYERNYS